MKIKRFMLAAIVLLASGALANAQNYKTGAGVRLGFDNGVTLKKFNSQSTALEGILALSPHYFQLTGLYEYQQPIADAPGLDWYLGIGLHIGSIMKDREYYDSSLLLGGDLIAGLEYVFPTVPFGISLDWKPSVNFTNNYNDYWYSGFALSIRYIIER